ncbi:HlyD family type I secretion periplasmic adaptor subunit [Frigidibacter sp. ROC022]|uniref:HlyD family type I secretion periplasmic adaptor subunit n=1 Tax=Frigidibacter sp. ROC022 TaxID=2971796 RepID=UPI00215B1F88|nr:HlyD family type I secretion periplasmic adaptor subunit [Frigidibacter sp. ROC022]MCR8725864.1 HlyD family type I secretion periplasmic adaptor subunit [Frigidibacter sp. ROC022]
MTKDRTEWYSAVPRSIRPLVLFSALLMLVSFGGFGAWAFRAPLAAAVISHGNFVATGQNKVVQHLEGGIIRAIPVSEGDRVEAGDALLELDRTAAQANLREIYLRRIRLEAIEARLRAVNSEADALTLPAHILAEAEDPDIRSIIDSQRLTFEVAKAALERDIALLASNIKALHIRTAGYEGLVRSYSDQAASLSEELETREALLAAGLMRQNEVSANHRALVEAVGEIGRLQAEIAEMAEVMQRYETEIEQAREERRQGALRELQGIQAELDSIREQETRAKDVLSRSVVAAPVSGTIVRLFYHTPGGVIESGKPIVEILPEDVPLIIEVAVLRTDIDSVRPGQPASIRLTALNQRVTPILSGRVEYVSADAVTDRSDGITREVYIARVALDPRALDQMPQFKPLPGMPAEVMIRTGERTFVQYLVKPIRDSMGRAFHER